MSSSFHFILSSQPLRNISQCSRHRGLSITESLPTLKCPAKGGVTTAKDSRAGMAAS